MSSGKTIMEELSAQEGTVLGKLRYLRHFDYHHYFDGHCKLLNLPTTTDTHGVGNEMGHRYVYRIIELVHVIRKTSELPCVDQRALMHVVDQLIEAKRGIGAMIQNNVDLSVPPITKPAERIEDVPQERIPVEVRNTLDLFAADYDQLVEFSGTRKRTPAQVCMASLRDALLDIARDLVIDAHVYPMRDREAPLALVHELFDCWLKMHGLIHTAMSKQ